MGAAHEGAAKCHCQQCRNWIRPWHWHADPFRKEHIWTKKGLRSIYTITTPRGGSYNQRRFRACPNVARNTVARCAEDSNRPKSSMERSGRRGVYISEGTREQTGVWWLFSIEGSAGSLHSDTRSNISQPAEHYNRSRLHQNCHVPLCFEGTS